MKGKYLTRLATSVMDRQLLHALGCDEKPAINRGSQLWFSPCKNYYAVIFTEATLEEAVRKGYAVRSYEDELYGKVMKPTTCYSVTVKGVSYLAEKYRVRIVVNSVVTAPLEKRKEKAA